MKVRNQLNHSSYLNIFILNHTIFDEIFVAFLTEKRLLLIPTLDFVLVSIVFLQEAKVSTSREKNTKPKFNGI